MGNDKTFRVILYQACFCYFVMIFLMVTNIIIFMSSNHFMIIVEVTKGDLKKIELGPLHCHVYSNNKKNYQCHGPDSAVHRILTLKIVYVRRDPPG